MLTFKIAWSYTKKYFWLITLVIGFILGLVLMIVARRPMDADWQKRIDELQKKHLEEVERIRMEQEKKSLELIKKYEATLSDIERQYAAKQKKLEEEKRKEIEDIIVQYGNDPVKVTQELAGLLPGIEVKLPEDFQ